jgi:hypothetical protein
MSLALNLQSLDILSFTADLFAIRNELGDHLPAHGSLRVYDTQVRLGSPEFDLKHPEYF